MQDLGRDAPEELTIGEYRRQSLGDLQEAMNGSMGRSDMQC